MRLTKVFVRFYKSFNFDYERKYNRSSGPSAWEMIDDAWYPFVVVDLEESITTIVGANESGKSHLLDAIEKVITGRGIERSDFCRYSHFFSMEQGQRRYPDFGCEFEVAHGRDLELVKRNLGSEAKIGDRILMFRLNNAEPTFYASGSGDPIKATPKPAEVAALLPSVFRLDAHTPLPDSVPIFELEPKAHRSYGSRSARRSATEMLFGKAWDSAEALKGAAGDFFSLLPDGSSLPPPDEETEHQYELARALLFKVANLDSTAFMDLSDAVADGKEGYANGVIQKMNDALATHLNFPRWWAQDREFKLLVSRSEYDIVFTIRDRTGTDYSFAERSNGLKFFLSYHVQLLAHRPPSQGEPEILLMDEPDAYLSSQGQQDLLRILEEFALPENQSRQDQVVFVTHSPFLINKNAATRIRVLDKGVTDEGTRVVRDVARNHYEPLRSALGAFVAETSFIGGSNLFVEGTADQILLAGTSSLLRAAGAGRLDTLDLNSITIVPAGSASSVPYLVYLARGRDVIRPPCVALLDGDQAGVDAAKALTRGGPRNRQILPKQFIVQLAEWAKGTKLSVDGGVNVEECEDLIALPVAVDAARNYAVHLLDLERKKVATLVEADVEGKLDETKGRMFDALRFAFAARFGVDAHIEKVGFAREVISALVEARRKGSLPVGYAETEQNFASLLSHLSALLRMAESEEQDRRLNNRLKRIASAFLADYPTPTTRENGRRLLEEINASTDKSDEGDRIRLTVDKMRRDFELDENLTRPIENYSEFTDSIKRVQLQGRFSSQDADVVVRDAPQSELAESSLTSSSGDVTTEATEADEGPPEQTD